MSVFIIHLHRFKSCMCRMCVCMCVVPELWPRHCVSCNKLLTFSPYCRHDEWLSVGLINSAECWLVVHRVCACPLLSWLIYFQGQHACPTGSALLDILGTEQKKKKTVNKWNRVNERGGFAYSVYYDLFALAEMGSSMSQCAAFPCFISLSYTQPSTQNHMAPCSSMILPLTWSFPAFLCQAHSSESKRAERAFMGKSG